MSQATLPEWAQSSGESFELEDGKVVTIHYLYIVEGKGWSVFIQQEDVVTLVGEASSRTALWFDLDTASGEYQPEDARAMAAALVEAAAQFERIEGTTSTALDYCGHTPGEGMTSGLR